MKLKHKALLYNFLCFAVIFIIARYLFGYFFLMHHLILAFMSAIIATVLAPKFAVANIKGQEKLMMKWIFKKGIKEL